MSISDNSALYYFMRSCCKGCLQEGISKLIAFMFITFNFEMFELTFHCECKCLRYTFEGKGDCDLLSDVGT